MDDRILPPVCVTGAEPCRRSSAEGEGGGGGWWGTGRSGCMAAENLSSKGFSSLLLCTKLAKKSQGGSSEWPPSWGKLRISSQLSSVLWNTKWEGGPFPLLQPLWNDVKHINQYKRVFQHQSVAWSCLWLSGMEAERSWLQAWRELGILSWGDVESICF